MTLQLLLERLYRWRDLLPTLAALGVLALVNGECCAPLCFAWAGSGALITLGGIGLRIWARRHIGDHTRGRIGEAPLLATQGPYRWLRHPLYLANGLCASGWMVVALAHAGESWRLAAMVLLWALVVLQWGALAGWEELGLARSHGERWQAWAAATPQWGLPLRRDRVEVESAEPRARPRSLLAAVVADRWTWFWQLLLWGALAVRLWAS